MPAAIESFAPPVASAADRELLSGLRARIDRIAGGAAVGRPCDAVPLGVAAIDSVLPGGGLPSACLHEIVAGDDSVAAAGFAAVLLAGFAGNGGIVVWCRRGLGSHGAKLYGPGLAAFGIDLRRLLVVRARRNAEVLWTMEESLRSGAVAAVLGEVPVPPPIALRRLQLATEAGGATGLLLRPHGAPIAAGSATTRWRVASAPSDPLTFPLRGLLPLPPGEGGGEGAHLPAVRWRVELLRCRAADAVGWVLDWHDETHRLGVVAELRDGPVAAVAAESHQRTAV
jgi:protein ImuA